jgi:hypothetical protein
MTPLSMPINTTTDSVNIYNYYIIAHFNTIIDDKLYIINAITFNKATYSSTNIFINTTPPPALTPTSLTINTTNPISIYNRSQLIEIMDLNNYYIYNNNKNKIIYCMNPIYAGLIIGDTQISDTSTYTINTGLIIPVPISNTAEALNIQQANNGIIKNENMPIFNSTGNNDIYIECGDPSTITNQGSQRGTGTRGNTPKNNDSKVFTIIIIILIIIGLVTHLIMIIDNPSYIITRNVEIFVLFFLMFFPLTIF